MIRPGSPIATAALVACALLFVSALAEAEGVSTTVDRDRIGTSESVVLTVSVDDARPATFGSLVDTDFRILAQSVQQSSRRDNRGVTRSTTLTLRLGPNRSGALTTGRVQIRLGTETVLSDAIAVTVEDRATVAPSPQPTSNTPVRPTRSEPPAGAPAVSPDGRAPPPPPPGGDGMYGGPVVPDRDRNTFIVATVSADAPTAGQPLLVDYLLFTPSMAIGVNGVDMSEPEFTDAWFLDVTEARRAQYGGRRMPPQSVAGAFYDVQVLRSYALVPLSTGLLSIPPLTLDVQIRASMGRTGVEQVASRPLVLDVAEPPAADRPDGFIVENVGRWELTAAMDRTRARVGDTVTLTLSIRGIGLASRLALPSLPAIAGVRALEPRDTADVSYGPTGWLDGTASRQIRLIPEREGTFEIPGVEWTTWDPFAQTYVTRTTDPLTLEVAGTNPNWEAPSTDRSAEVGSWVNDLPPTRALDVIPGARAVWRPDAPWAAATVLPWLAWMTVLLVDWRRRRRASGADERREREAGKRALKALHDAQGHGDTAAIARGLRAYLADVVGRAALGQTTTALRATTHERLGDPGVALVDLIEQCDRARYEGTGDIGALLRDAEAAVRAVEATR